MRWSDNLLNLLGKNGAPERRLSDLEDEIAGHILQFPLPDIKVPRVLNNGETWFTLDTVTLGQMERVLAWVHMTRALNKDTYKLLKLMFMYAEAADTPRDAKFQEFAIMLCGDERTWQRLVKD